MDVSLSESLLDCCRYAQSGRGRDKPRDVVIDQTFSGAFAHTSNAVWLKFRDRQVLVFQGTLDDGTKREFYDWLYNLRAAAVEALDLPGRVHGGFASHLKPLLPPILEKLQKHGRESPLYVTGFSQGGALALLTSQLLAMKEISVAATYVYAAPRVGDAAFVKSLTTPVYRFEYGCDIVPHVPFKQPDSLLFRLAWDELKDHLPRDVVRLLDHCEECYAVYGHAGALYYRADADEAWQTYDAAGEKQLLSRRAVKLLSAGKRLCDDHRLEFYRQPQPKQN